MLPISDFCFFLKKKVLWENLSLEGVMVSFMSTWLGHSAIIQSNGTIGFDVKVFGRCN